MITEDKLGALLTANKVFLTAWIEGVGAFLKATESDIVFALFQTLVASRCRDKGCQDGQAGKGREEESHFE